MKHSIVIIMLAGLWVSPLCAQFHVPPYVQYPRPDAMTVIWFSKDKQQGTITCATEDGSKVIGKGQTAPALMKVLAHTPWEVKTYFKGIAPALPYRHMAHLKNLIPRTTYRYKVVQGTATFESTFTTAPKGDAPVRFIVYADCETEPESTGKPVRWINPAAPGQWRPYLVDQTIGYSMNLQIIHQRKPNFIMIAGDIVQVGGEQRDWDEFWKHNAKLDPKRSVAGSIPIMAVVGNHDYFAGNHGGPWHRGYGGNIDPVGRLLAYFHLPDHQLEEKSSRSFRGRFYRFDYGPVTMFAIDTNNAPPHRSPQDTNFGMTSTTEGGGRVVPSFQPGSVQYQWLDTQLAMARKTSRFIFVSFHHTPYSSGPHGRQPGIGDDLDTLSSVPAQSLTPLFMKHRVDAVFGGHDEMFERSEITDPKSKHVLHVYDVGIGGDGLRAPTPGVTNPHRKFIAHLDAPEIWQDGQLVEGGKHYGHLEVNVAQDGDQWKAVLTPVYVLPVFDAKTKKLNAFKRMIYKDTVTLIAD